MKITILARSNNSKLNNSKSITYTFILFFLLNFSFSMHAQNYVLVDSIVDTYPKNISTLDNLAEYIRKDFKGDDEKARAIFRWITTNISFDVELAKKMNYKSLIVFSYFSEKEKEIKEKKFKSDLVKETFLTRKTVCHGYSVLIEYLCGKLDLEAKIIIGTLKSDPSEIGVFPNEFNYAWNVVKINDEWKFIDATLGAGSISSNTGLFKFDYNDGYFFTDPERFFLNHYPLDEKWLLVSKTKNDFAQAPFIFGNYFKYGYKIIGPISGIHSKKNGNFIFSLKGLDEYDNVQYALNSDNKIVFLEQEDNTKEFSIDITNIVNDYISIFVIGKVIAVYKIVN